MTKKNRNLILLSAVLLFGAVGGYIYYQKNRFYFAPRNETNLFTLGQIEASRGRHVEAIAVYKELLSKDPKHTIAMRYMIESMIQLQDRSQILPALDQLILTEPTVDNLEFAISICLKLQNKEKADFYKNKLEAVRTGQ